MVSVFSYNFTRRVTPVVPNQRRLRGTSQIRLRHDRLNVVRRPWQSHIIRSLPPLTCSQPAISVCTGACLATNKNILYIFHISLIKITYVFLRCKGKIKLFIWSNRTLPATPASRAGEPRPYRTLHPSGVRGINVNNIIGNRRHRGRQIAGQQRPSGGASAYKKTYFFTTFFLTAFFSGLQAGQNIVASLSLRLDSFCTIYAFPHFSHFLSTGLSQLAKLQLGYLLQP